MDDASEEEDDGDDERGDAGDQEAVLDCGGATLVAAAGDGADVLEHGVPAGTVDFAVWVSARPGVVAWPGATRDCGSPPPGSAVAMLSRVR